MTTLDTGIEGRNKHMQSPDFLDTAKFPKATLKLKQVKTSGDKALAPNKALIVVNKYGEEGDTDCVAKEK